MKGRIMQTAIASHRLPVLPVAVIALLAFAAARQNILAQYSLLSSSFAAVGRESSGGSYTVSSSIGNVGGATTASEGSFSVTSSPWMVAVVESPGSPKLTIVAASGSMSVSWPSLSTGWVLQQNTNGVTSVNWSNVTATIQDDGITKSLTVNPAAGSRFYRLVHP